MTESQSSRERIWIYAAAAVLIGVTMLWAILAFSAAQESQRAEEKADALIAALEDAGARTPDRDQIVRVLGDDGGATCESPNEALSRATFHALLMNGAAGPGVRPIIADTRAVRGQLLIMEVYCPDELEEFRDFIEDLKTDDVTRY